MTTEKEFEKEIERLKKIIKRLEKTAGYRICNLCDKSINMGERIVLLEEYKDKIGCILSRKVGAVCKECFLKNFQRRFLKEK